MVYQSFMSIQPNASKRQRVQPTWTTYCQNSGSKNKSKVSTQERDSFGEHVNLSPMLNQILHPDV
ncbi:MAG: hypothetical protein EOP04_09470 [Proteobacteria bacterium]|nr:MAG: hypothetical protein EOP04_09470 [Pseudomonadota bacterium]